jgi:hypothetical protein
VPGETGRRTVGGNRNLKMAAADARRHMEVAERYPILHMNQRARGFGARAQGGREAIVDIGNENQLWAMGGEVGIFRPARLQPAPSHGRKVSGRFWCKDVDIACAMFIKRGDARREAGSADSENRQRGHIQHQGKHWRYGRGRGG